MCWHKLTHSELQACRKLLMLDVTEAAEWIGKVSNRSWQRWESGQHEIPGDVDEEIYACIQRQQNIVSEYTQWQLDNEGEMLKMPYYHTFDQYAACNKGATKLDWRIHQSAVAFVFSEGGEVELT